MILKTTIVSSKKSSLGMTAVPSYMGITLIPNEELSFHVLSKKSLTSGSEISIIPIALFMPCGKDHSEPAIVGVDADTYKDINMDDVRMFIRGVKKFESLAEGEVKFHTTADTESFLASKIFIK